MKSFISKITYFSYLNTHSTEHAILNMVNTIQTNMERLFSFGVFNDLKKAFETVHHKILLYKLDDYLFRGVINKWFSSYLQGTTQKTQIGSYTVYLKEKILLAALFMTFLENR